MNPVERLILGHMPFVGISYHSEEKDEEYSRRFSRMRATMKVMEAAVTMGVCKFAAATPRSSPLSPVHLQVLQLMIAESHGIELLPCIEIPVRLGDVGIDAHRRWATYVNLEGRQYPEAKKHILNDPILNYREDWKNRLNRSKPYREEEFQRLNIDWNMIDKDLEFFVELPVIYIEFGSEADFLIMTGRFDLLGELVDRAKGHGFQNVLFGIHHAGMTIPILNDSLEGFHGFVTPLNPLGAMMFPTKSLVERAVRNVKVPIFAIKPLAGGRTTPRKAFTYIFDFNVKGCMIGASSVVELKEDIEIAINVAENMK